MTPNNTLQQLLKIMLNTVLNNEPYPGQDAPQSFFPDIELIQDSPEIILSDQNLSPHCIIDIQGYQCAVLPVQEITTRANELGDFPYLALTEAHITGSSAVLSLSLKWAVSEASQELGKYYISGGGVRVKFIKEDGEWISPTGPLATWMS